MRKTKPGAKKNSSNNAIHPSTDSKANGVLTKKKQPGITRVALYVRVSKRDGSQTTENQIAQLMEYAERQNGWEVVLVFSDNKSGATAERIQLKAMFEAAEHGYFDVLLFWALDRLTREGTLETLLHLKQLSDLNVKWKSLTEEYIDNLGPWGQAIAGFMATIAKLERLRRSERTLAALERIKRLQIAGPTGQIGPGRPKVIFDIHKVKAMREDGDSLRQIALKLGIPRTVITRRLDGHKPESLDGHKPETAFK